MLSASGSAPALADALALPKTAQELPAAALIASLMLSNAGEKKQEGTLFTSTAIIRRRGRANEMGTSAAGRRSR